MQEHPFRDGTKRVGFVLGLDVRVQLEEVIPGQLHRAVLDSPRARWSADVGLARSEPDRPPHDTGMLKRALELLGVRSPNSNMLTHISALGHNIIQIFQ